MIGHLRGRVLDRQPPRLLLDVSGVGYEIEVPMSAWPALPQAGEETGLWTHLQVREDGQALYGFAAQDERDLFRSLIRVSGVGPKLGLAILSGMSAGEFVHVVREGQTAKLVQIPGVGRKTAERLVLEMRDKLNSLPAFADGVEIPAGEAAPANLQDEAIQALVVLGYKEQEAAKLVSRVGESHTDSAALIRAALKLATQKA